MTTRRAILRGALTAGTMAALAISSWAEDAPESADPVHFMIADINGTIVTDETLLGKFALIYFGYTGCPDICPTSMLTMSEVLEKLGDLADRIIPVFVTVDPDRDTPKLLSEYVSAFDKRIVALRGPKPYLDRMCETFKVKYEFYVPDAKHPEDYTVDHTASIIFLGPEGRIIKRFPHGLETDMIVTDVRAALDAVPAN